MLKRKTFKKRGFSFNDMPILEPKNLSKLRDHNPEQIFKDFDAIASALLECLSENDTESFIEILDAYLRVNRSQVAKKGKMARSTVQQALSKSGNPTLKTIAKIVHRSCPIRKVRRKHKRVGRARLGN